MYLDSRRSPSQLQGNWLIDGMGWIRCRGKVLILAYHRVVTLTIWSMPYPTRNVCASGRLRRASSLAIRAIYDHFFRQLLALWKIMSGMSERGIVSLRSMMDGRIIIAIAFPML